MAKSVVVFLSEFVEWSVGDSQVSDLRTHGTKKETSGPQHLMR